MYRTGQVKYRFMTDITMSPLFACPVITINFNNQMIKEAAP
ncbi:MAG: hypothetical protein WC374_11720 [Phycisphaerae bacterium]